MSSILQAYDTLPSETPSTSPALYQPENRLSCEEAESSTTLPTSDLSSRTCVSWNWTNWKWEFAACLLVLASPFIIVGTLYPHNGQPLPQWPFKISINSLLSVYALVLKATIGFILTSCIGQLQWAWFSETRPLTDMLRFDSATRGADGALSLIWRQRFRQPLTALGCFIMILAVAVDPFIQQLVQPVDCSIELSGAIAAATLPRTNVFDDYSNGDSSDYEMRDDFQQAIENVLYSAIFNPGQDPPWQCSTGNCTFQDTYGTIGICYSCQDISADVVINATCSHPNSSYASQHPTSGTDCPGNSSFTVESDITVTDHMKLGTKMNIPSQGDFDTIVLADANALEGTKMSFEFDGRDLYFGFLIGATANSGGRIDWTNSTCNSDESKKSWACQGYGAATCSLKPCIQIYNATISAGILEENLVASSSSTAWGTFRLGLNSSYSTLVDTQCSAGTQISSSGDSSAGGRWLPYDYTLTDADAEPDDTDSEFDFHLPNEVATLLDNGCLYLMSAGGTMNWLEHYLSGTVQGNVSVAGHDGLGTDDRLVAVSIGGISEFTGPEIVRSIYNWGHTDFERVQSAFANISDSLTTYIRTHGGTSRLPGGTKFSRDVEGKTSHYATCLQVPWPWLSYPASLVVLTTWFFLMVVEVTRRQGDSVWKASPLAWILRVEGTGNEIVPSSHGSYKKLKDRSTQIAVHLFDGDLDGPRIRIADLKDPHSL